MNYIIIDDEPIARKGIRLLADEIVDLNCLGEYANPIIAEQSIPSLISLDLIFLDIEMPGLDGIQYLKDLRPDASVILTTAYSQYALEAFELDVVDYLLKPIKMSRFLKAVQKVREYKELILNQGDFNSKEQTIYIKSDRKFIKLHLNNITYIKGLKDYVVIHTKTHKYMTAMNVGTIDKQLPKQTFARVSKSYIINTDYISSIELDSIWLGELEIPLGNTYKEGFLKKFVKSSLLKR